jgi:hypothetical protein
MGPDDWRIKSDIASCYERGGNRKKAKEYREKYRKDLFK